GAGSSRPTSSAPSRNAPWPAWPPKRSGSPMTEPIRHRVAITGIGPNTAGGIGAHGLWEGLRPQRPPTRRITRCVTSPWRSRIGAEIDDFEPERYMDPRTARRLDRYSQFAIAATRMALEDARLDPGRLDPDRAAVQMGSALGGVAYAENQVVNFLTRGVRAVDPRVALTTFGGAASCSIEIGRASCRERVEICAETCA